ncbi:MAG TPA: hypothetical protein DET40_00255 [Lentisphaeria bacterium]|nr:MAG: hypothetical protein A2X45_20255 [Lentisphaerae bacterium GWF2_50_93]HCE41964.1 hypothetical protein [Lentisphaeria bacterium]
MKKLIAAAIGLCMIGYAIQTSAENTCGTENKAGNGPAKCEKNRPSPEQVAAKIDERLKKLEEHKTKASSAGKTDIVNAIQGLEDALKNLRQAASAKDKEKFKAAMEQVKTAREALKNLVPEKVKERVKNRKGNSDTGNAPKL